eukprot:CAMPEP_0173154112 /NCGR_PEP_ID=MMETSP1105-20130129/13283_1 /TAXON_ID=2985 /ORGANISM="Ochromonas sp., Strain BG-1" /LENGTH=202 /DNA_ID=CAMNT_0014070219 /DNA_START=66 /DNA_END=674 /DNA_ORIENTATION=-
MNTGLRKERLGEEKKLPCEAVFINLPKLAKAEHRKRSFDDTASEISELTDDSTFSDGAEDSDDYDTDSSYDSIDEIDEKELEELLRFSSRVNHTKRLFSPSKSHDYEETQKRRRLNDVEKSGDDMFAEVTADAIFDLFVERMPLPLITEENDKTALTTTSCSSSSNGWRSNEVYNPHVFRELIVDSSLNSFWNTITSMEKDR